MTIVEAVKALGKKGGAVKRAGGGGRLITLTGAKRPFLASDIYQGSAAFWDDDLTADDWEVVDK